MKNYKILSIAIIGLALFSTTYGFDFTTDCEKQTFVVTAYYSPEDDQTFYYKPSVEDEKTLNGNGTHGANGQAVFNGMLAAPSTYDFGGKIYFPSLGVGEIADRGGAIVHAGERGDSHDRIDIWMGKGEEGLVRALTFGKRTVTGYYCTKQELKTLGANPKVGLNFDAIPVLKYFFDSALFIQELVPERTDVRVYKLQEYLMKFGYMDTKTGYFGPQTKAALCNYQIKKGITSRKYCGTFGSRTRYYMKTEAKAKGLLPDFGQTTTFEDLISYAINYNGSQKSSEIVNSPSIIANYFTQAYKKGESNEKISDLQDMLRHFGFYQGELNNNYDHSTINAVHNFQVAASILRADDYSSPARGWMGPSTRKGLNEKRNEFQNWKNQNTQ